MKKIAFISTNEWGSWGGSEYLWSRTAMRLASQGSIIGVNVKKWDKDPPQIQELENLGCLVEKREYKRSLFQRIVSRLVRKRSHFDWLDDFSPSFIVVSTGLYFEAIEWIEACSEKRIPFVIVSHCVAEQLWPIDMLAERAIKAYGNAKKWFFVSRKSIELAEVQLGVKLENAEVIRNPCNVSYDVSLPWPPADSIKLACVADLEPLSKGQDILFKVLSYEKWRKRPVTVSLFGRGGYNEKSLKRLKAMLRLDNVQFCGSKDSIESIWREHHALIMPSRYEGLPLVLVEAMLCGRPSIVTDVGGISELVTDNINGFIAEAPLPRLLDDAMERAWQRKDSWEKMGQEAARFVRTVMPPDPVGEFITKIEPLF